MGADAGLNISTTASMFVSPVLLLDIFVSFISQMCAYVTVQM